MTYESILQFRRAEPFRPIDIFLKDGSIVRIEQPERFLAASDYMMYVNNQGSFSRINYNEISDIKHVPFGEDDLSLCSLDAWM